MAKNIVLGFDRIHEQGEQADATNVENLFHLIEDNTDQLAWYHPGTADAPVTQPGPLAALRWRSKVFEDTRATVIEAYEFLAATWSPGDRIYLFGIGRGAYCARAVTRLLSTVGILSDGLEETDDFLDYVLTTLALPRTTRTAEDWQHIAATAAGVAGRDTAAVPVQFLGLWDAVKVPGLPAMGAAEHLDNVLAGRHAVAIDGGPFGDRLAEHSPAIEEVWFRGAHSDVTGGHGACRALADIAMDWMLDGATHAGIAVRGHDADTVFAPSEADALAGSPRHLWLRKVPADALMHASVDLYLRAHPQYWRRLPHHVQWADAEWLARGERLLPDVVALVPAVEVGVDAEPAAAEELAAVAS